MSDRKQIEFFNPACGLSDTPSEQHIEFHSAFFTHAHKRRHVKSFEERHHRIRCVHPKFKRRCARSVFGVNLCRQLFRTHFHPSIVFVSFSSYLQSPIPALHREDKRIRTPYFCFRFSFYSLLLFVYFNYAAAFGNACLYGLRSDFGLMFRVQPFRKPNDMLIQCKNRTFSFIIGLCSVIHAVKQEHRPVEFKRKLHRLRIG